MLMIQSDHNKHHEIWITIPQTIYNMGLWASRSTAGLWIREVYFESFLIILELGGVQQHCCPIVR